MNQVWFRSHPRWLGEVTNENNFSASIKSSDFTDMLEIRFTDRFII